MQVIFSPIEGQELFDKKLVNKTPQSAAADSSPQLGAEVI